MKHLVQQLISAVELEAEMTRRRQAHYQLKLEKDRQRAARARNGRRKARSAQHRVHNTKQETL